IDGVDCGLWFSLNINESIVHRSDLEWSEVIRRLPAGTHHIKWTYSANRDSQMNGTDTSWIDRIQIVRNMDLGEVISFPDSRIDQQIRNMIGKASGEAIRAKEVQDICLVFVEDTTNGQLPSESILERALFSVEGFERFNSFEEQMGLPFDLTGLQYCKDLSALNLAGAYVDNIEILSQTERLQLLGLCP
ncbi:MAG TPA: hypothetical protein DCY45_04685, partial [Mesotoga sp.]|nr:hypothetical protein [Mesotoga sp.]